MRFLLSWIAFFQCAVSTYIAKNLQEAVFDVEADTICQAQDAFTPFVCSFPRRLGVEFTGDNFPSFWLVVWRKVASA